MIDRVYIWGIIEYGISYSIALDKTEVRGGSL
jgi:hypothetical protein